MWIPRLLYHLLELNINSAVEVVRRGKGKSNTSGSGDWTSHRSLDVEPMWEPGDWPCTDPASDRLLHSPVDSGLVTETFPQLFHTSSKDRIFLHHFRNTFQTMNNG
jgi:hypothetical protein